MKEITTCFVQADDGLYDASDSAIRQRITELFGFRYDLIEIVSVTWSNIVNIMGYPCRVPYHIVFRVCGIAYSTYFDGDVYRERISDAWRKDEPEQEAEVA